MSHSSADNLATGWLGVSTHALLLRPSNHIYAAVTSEPERGTLAVLQPAECE